MHLRKVPLSFIALLLLWTTIVELSNQQIVGPTLTRASQTTVRSIKHIIFDFGFVLVEPSKLKMFGFIGRPLDVAWQFLSHGLNEEKARERCYEVLVYAAGEQEGDADHFLYDHRGVQLPRLMAEWQLGKITSSQVYALIDITIEKLIYSHYFTDVGEARIIKNIIKKVLFNPKALSQGMVPAEGAKLLKKLYKEKNEDGSGRYSFYILSNWDAESFDEFCKSEDIQKKILRYFDKDKIVYSGKYGMGKPNPEFYQLLLSLFDLDPEECLFIDDQPENIETAKALGLQTILWNKKEASRIEKMLKEMNLLS